MTEKTESFEVYPMKGHSRGEWYGTLGDIVESAELAEYWAVFGVTHRGNKHCLGEFPTESAAWAAVKGLKIFPPTRVSTTRSIPSPGVVISHGFSISQSRTIVQLEVLASSEDRSMLELFALCNDGTVWHRGIGVRDNRGFIEEAWTEITLNGLRE